MSILQEKDAGHSDLSLLAISLINKVCIRSVKTRGV